MLLPVFRPGGIVLSNVLPRVGFDLKCFQIFAEMRMRITFNDQERLLAALAFRAARSFGETWFVHSKPFQKLCDVHFFVHSGRPADMNEMYSLLACCANQSYIMSR